MDSSDEELFNAPSCNKSKINTSLNLAKQTNDLVQDSIKEKDCVIKDISVKITRLPNGKKKNNTANTNLNKSKRKRSMWKYGSYKKSSKKKKSKKFVTQQKLEKEKSPTKVMESLENKINDNIYVCLNKSSQNIEKSYVATQQDVQDGQNTQENVKNFTLSTNKIQNEENLCADNTLICARILPYDFYQKRNATSSNNTTGAVPCYDIATSSSSSDNKTTKQNSSTDKIYVPKYTLSRKERSMKILVNERLRRLSKKLAIETLNNEWKSKRKRSPSTLFESRKRKHCQIILSDESSDDEDAIQRKRISSIEMIGYDNRNKSHSFYKNIDQEKSQSNIQISHEVHINLTRLEEMDDVDVIKWRVSKIKNAFEEIIESKSVEQQLDKQKQVTLGQRNEVISSNGSNLSETQDIHKDLLQLSTVSNTYVNKHHPTRLNDSLDMIKLKKKYKLFKKPRVLIIKLESIINSPKNGKYSAIEIDYLTKRYINFVISCTSSKLCNSLLYGLASLQRKSITDQQVNVTRTKEDKTEYNLSGRHCVNKKFKQSDINESSTKDDQTEQESSNNKNAFFKFAAISSHQSQHKNLSPKMRNQNSNSPQRTLLEIWRNAFCTQTSVMKPQIPSIEQSASAQSTSTETVSILRNSLEKSANTECKSSVSSSLASTSTTKNNTPVKSPEKHVSPKKQESAQSPKCNKTSSLNSSKVCEQISLKSFEKPSNFQSSINDKTPVKMSKMTSEERINNQSSSKNTFTCITTCNMSFENVRLLVKHQSFCNKVTSLLRGNASRHKEHIKNEKIIDEVCQNKNKYSKLSTSQQNSINKESNFHKSDRTLNNTDKEQISSSSLSLPSDREMQSKNIMTPQTKTKTKPIVKSNFELNLRSRSGMKIKYQSFPSVNKDKGKQCKVCLRFFNTYLQLFDHMFKHANHTIKNAYLSNKNNSSSMRQNTNKNSRVSDTLIGVEAVTKNANESNTDPNLALQVLQRDAAKETDKTSNLLQAETEQNSEKEQSMPAVNDGEHEPDRLRYVEREKECVIAPSMSICQCHRPKTVDKNHNKIQIEIVAFCQTCKVLFRRHECFKTHYQQATDASNARHLARKRQHNRMPKLLCVTCQKALNSIPDLQTHLTMHTQLNRNNSEVTFLCNICKVIFYAQGPLFNNHFSNHIKHPLFLASRLTFPPNSYIGIKLIESAMDNNEKQMEVYIQVAEYKCRECSAPFTSEENLQLHEALCRDKVAVAANDNGSDGRNASSATSEKMPIWLICGFCDKTFYKRMHFELHSLEHKQKQNLHSHYTCVDVTPITKVFICKVCLSMWKSLKFFEEHWQTHNILQEDYICSLCPNHYDTIDLFHEHAITHRNSSEKQHTPILCKVIYRDKKVETNSQQTAINNDLSSIILSSLDGKKSSEIIADDNQIQLRATVLQNLVKNKQSTRVETMTISQENDANAQTPLAQVPSIDVNQNRSKSKQATKNRNNEKDKSSNDNSENLDDSEDEELIIVVSESESSMSSEVKKTRSRKSNDASSIKHNDTQEGPTRFNRTMFVSDGQKQCSSDASSSTAASAKSSDNVSKTLNSNAAVSSTKELVTQLEANVSEDNEITVEHTNIVDLSTTTRQADNACKNSADSDSTSSKAKSPRKEAKDMSLPQNAMSSIPKSFLRVKSLAELTDGAPQSFLCHVCGLLFDSLYKLTKHKMVHTTQYMQNANEAHTSDNVQMWQEKPEFNSSMQIQHHAPHSITGNVFPSGNVPASGNVLPSGNAPPSGNVALSGNVFPSSNALPSDNTSLSGNVSASGNAPPSSNVSSTGYVFPFGNMPPSGSVNPFRSVNPSGSVNSSSNIASSGNVTNRPVNLDNSRQYQVVGVGIKPLHKVPYNTITNKVANTQAQQYNSAWLQTFNNPIVASQQMMQQKPIYHQNLPAQIGYPVTTTIQPVHQSIGTVAIRPFVQTIQTPRPPPPPYPQQQQQQQLQQKQQQQTQHTNASNDVRNYATVLSKESVPYQLASNNTVSANSTNIMLLHTTMLQVSQNPNRYICLYCPGFECSSVQDFELHERSSKHEARSNYISTSYVPRT
ncbi:uncharacterized protein [Anoplolepis gracilipes]|uniref:uncharacterized protein n=1 Tax=Anoplolepis gracilipes TaxID=354296 RepID=UPI003B9E0709